MNLRKKLGDLGYLSGFRVLGTGKQGRAQCDMVTEKANMRKAPHPRGGLLHSWWCYRVGEFYEKKGADVKVGDTISGNECDLGVKLNGRRIGVEVVVSGLVVDNLEKFIAGDYYDEMLVLTIDLEKMKEMEKLITVLSDETRKRVKIQLLRGYYFTL